MKDYRGHDTISCGEAAKFYINPDIPEVLQYYERLGLHLPEIQWMKAEDDQYQKAYKQSDPEEIDIATLLSKDPYDLLGMSMVGTVTIMKLQSESWWFLACMKCHKTACPAGSEFVCSDSGCPCVAAGLRYKVCLIGNDTTAEAQFVLFAGVAEQLIGKKVDILQRTSDRKQGAIPAEITALISQKVTINFSVIEKSLEFEELAFQVNRIDMIHTKANKFQFQALASGCTQRSSILIAPQQVQPTEQETQGSNTLSKNSTNEHESAKDNTPRLDKTTPTSKNKEVLAPGKSTDAQKKDHGKRVLTDEGNISASKKLFKSG